MEYPYVNSPRYSTQACYVNAIGYPEPPHGERSINLDVFDYIKQVFSPDEPGHLANRLYNPIENNWNDFVNLVRSREKGCTTCNYHSVCIVIAVDGASLNNGRAKNMVFSAAGVYTGRNNSLNKAYAILQVSVTNQKAEMEAATLGLQTAMSIKTNAEAGYTISRFVIKTDSRYVFDCITKHIRRWKINGWMTVANTPVANQELWKKLESAIEEVGSRKKAKVLFCRGPRTYNKEADFQANEGFNAMKCYNLEGMLDNDFEGDVRKRHGAVMDKTRDFRQAGGSPQS